MTRSVTLSRLPLPLLALILGCNPVGAVHDFIAARPKESSLPTPLPPPAALSGSSQAKEPAPVAPINPVVQPLAPPAAPLSSPSTVQVVAPGLVTKTAAASPSTTPAAMPSPAAEPVALPPKTDRVRIHVLRRGETMTAVARRYGLPPGELLAANDYTWDDHPVVGARIQLTTTDDGTWTIRRRQGLDAIADTLGTSTAALAAANGITNLDEIYAGQVLVVPSR